MNLIEDDPDAVVLPPGTLIQAVLDPRNLQAAWEHVQASDIEDGEPSPSVLRFAKDVSGSLTALSESLSAGTWKPSPLTAINIPKRTGGARTLQVPSGRDRVLERAIAQIITPRVDPLLGPTSFAYRPGLGIHDALQEVARLRDSGFAWASRGDIKDCFDRINRARLLRLVSIEIDDSWLLATIAALLDRPTSVGSRFVRTRVGLAQGSGLSPLLANLYLEEFDAAIQHAGFPIIRYADDFVVMAETPLDAAAAAEVVRSAAESIELEVNIDKTEVMAFQEGFAFLGEEVNHRYPVLDGHMRRDEPLRKALYVGHQGSGVRIDSGRVVVARDTNELLSVPSSHVGRLVLSGSVGLTSGARAWALREGVDVVFLSRRGGFEGSLLGAQLGDAQLRRAQYVSTGDPVVRLAMARVFVSGKLANLRAQLRRSVRRTAGGALPEAIQQISSYSALLDDASTVDEVMGIEGIASKVYFGCWSSLLPETIPFEGRTRQPPGDVVNAALGYGYAILEGECVSSLVSAGLDPIAGWMHADHRRRPSLALDLMEEFRPLIVDTVVIELFRRGALGIEHGRAEQTRAGVWLTSEGRKRLVAALEDRLLTRVGYPPTGQRVSYRRVLRLQAAALAAVVRTGGRAYRSVGWR